MMTRSRRGITLPELLGTIVILALVVSLLGAVAFSMIRAADRIAVNQSAETIGLALVDHLEGVMERAVPNTHSTSCTGDGGCVVLVQEYLYVYDPLAGTIDPVVHATPVETAISIHDAAIWIDGVALGSGSFTIGPTSTLTVSSVSGTTTVTIAFTLVSADDRTFPFSAVYRFTESTVPA